jgi:hypothetical protein
MSPRYFRLTGSAILLAAAVFACSEGSTTTPSSDNMPSLAAGGGPGQVDIGEFELCKWGTRAGFRTIIDGATQPRFRLGPDQCQVLATTAALGVGNHTVTVIEDVPVGGVLDSIVPDSMFVSDPSSSHGIPITGTVQITKTFNGDRGWLVNFYNH